MAKGKDLFELLHLRQKISHGGAPKRRSSGGGSWTALRDRIAAWFGTAPRGTKRGARAALSERRDASAWLPVLAVFLVVFSFGFVLGRWTRAEATELRSPRGGPVRPGVVGVPDLTPEQEAKALSKFFFFVLHYPASQRSQASRLAYHLRKHGVSTARILEWPFGDPRPWAVLAYAPERDRAAAILDSLKAVPAPEFEPRLVEKLRRGFKLKEIDPDHK